MVLRKCAWCGEMKPFLGRQRFCSRRCFLLDRQKALTKEDSAEVVLPPLEHICDEGFVNLTTAIIQQARDDVMQNAPGTCLREDAEAFFMSDTFYEMTNLDGFDILCKLQDKYDEKMRKKEKAFVTQRVRCVETNAEYENIKAAAEVYGISPKTIYNACKGFNKTAVGRHWEYVGGAANE